MDARLEAWNELTPVIAVHLATALFALALGGFVLWTRKGTRLHKLLGRIWVAMLGTVAISSFWIGGFVMEGHWSPIHLLSVYTLFSLAVGIGAMILRERIGVARAMRIHRATMMNLYAGALLIAGRLHAGAGPADGAAPVRRPALVRERRAAGRDGCGGASPSSGARTGARPVPCRSRGRADATADATARSVPSRSPGRYGSTSCWCTDPLRRREPAAARAVRSGTPAGTFAMTKLLAIGLTSLTLAACTATGNQPRNGGAGDVRRTQAAVPDQQVGQVAGRPGFCRYPHAPWHAIRAPLCDIVCPWRAARRHATAPDDSRGPNRTCAGVAVGRARTSTTCAAAPAAEAAASAASAACSVAGGAAEAAFASPFPAGAARAGASGGGFGTIILLIVLFFALRACGIDPLEMLAGGQGGSVAPYDNGQVVRTQPAPSAGASDAEKQFVGVVLAETEDVWNGVLQQQGIDYPEPTLTMFSDAVRSGCGQASAATGPFYCPLDQRIYLDTAFFSTLARRFGAAGGLRAGLRDRPRGRPPRPERHRSAAEVQPDALAHEPGGRERHVRARRVAGGLLRRHLGALHRPEGSGGKRRHRRGR